jgi:hypothetical protein
MSKDLFQINKQRNVYSALDAWAMLSPRLVTKESDKALLDKERNESEITVKVTQTE